ncbi:MAG: branched-chain amino acid ABC transporter permease, partial [Spirochaetaceae bacterium]
MADPTVSPPSRGRAFLHGLRVAAPIAVGYVPVAITFGILGRAAGIAAGPVTAMSLIVFAGAAQFMALSLIASGTGAGQIMLAVFLLNLRHLLFGANLSRRLPRLSRPMSALLAFGLTDEVFSVASTEPPAGPGQQLDPYFVMGVEAGAWFAWSAGTVIGYAGGAFLSQQLAVAFATGLYALFASIAVWQV